MVLTARDNIHELLLFAFQLQSAGCDNDRSWRFQWRSIPVSSEDICSKSAATGPS